MELRIRNRRKTEDEQREIAELFAKGYTSESIGTKMGCSHAYVYTCRDKYGSQIALPVEQSETAQEDLATDELPVFVSPYLAEPAEEQREPQDNEAPAVLEKKTFKKTSVYMRKLPDDKKEEIIRLITTTPLSQDNIAKQVGVGENTVTRAWKAAQLENPDLRAFPKIKKAMASNVTTEDEIAEVTAKPASRIPAPSVNVFADDDYELPKREPDFQITDDIRNEVLRRYVEDFENVFEIKEKLGMPSITLVNQIIKEDKGAYKKAYEKGRPY